MPKRVPILDTHTAGEPTRVVVGGGPDLGDGPLGDRRERLRRDFDGFRAGVVNEPRGSDILVAAILVEPHEPACAAGVLFANNVGPLGMCGHGTMGVAVALGHLGRLIAGAHRFDTPVGVVTVEYDGANRVTVENVPAYRHLAGVTVTVEGLGEVVGDVAWGGNWFFLTHDFGHTLTVAHAAELTAIAGRIRRALRQQGVTGAGGAEVDHVELCGPPGDAANDGRNFVLCSGGAYDRSPCGTGTSAKLACLAADGKLLPGQIWRQEGILGTAFVGELRRDREERLVPRITGEAFVTAEGSLVFDPRDPFASEW